MRESGYVIFFFSIPWLLIEVIGFLAGAIFLQPIEMGTVAYKSIITWTNNYTGILLIVLAIIGILISMKIGKTTFERIIYMPSIFLGFWLVYNLILYGITDLVRGLEGMWFIFAVIFGIIWLLLVFVFIVLAIIGTVLPICLANNIDNRELKYGIKATISLIVSGIAIWLNFMFSTSFWEPAGRIFLALVGE